MEYEQTLEHVPQYVQGPSTQEDGGDINGRVGGTDKEKPTKALEGNMGLRHA